MGLQYTQHTRAFPTLPLQHPIPHPSVREELHLSWEWEGDEEGINGGISLYWYRFGGHPSAEKWSIQWEFFTDSVELFKRAEIQDLLDWLQHCDSEGHNCPGVPHWNVVIAYLDRLGFTPSSYHLQHDQKEEA